MSLTSLNAQQSFSNFQAANLVIGQANFTSSVSTIDAYTGANSACSDISSTGRFAVGGQGSGRILLYNSVPSVNGASASIVVGKTDFTTSTSGCTQNLCSGFNGVIFSPDGNKLIASDSYNHRVLIWNTIPTTNGQNADVVIGQTSFTSNASGCAADKFNFPAEMAVTPSGQLIIADLYNNRVLVYNKIPTTNGASADLVLGQPNFTTNTSGSGANKFSGPWGIALSSTGKLAVADHFNHRVLIFNSIPTAIGGTANVVVGQSTFTNVTPACTQNQANYPIGVSFSPDGKLAVSEFGNHRVMIYNTIPSSNGVNADIVLGQPSFTSSTAYNGGVNAQTMNEPYGINFDFNGRLFVNGRAMSRTMVFGTVPTQTAEIAISMVGSSSNLCLGSEISFTVNVQNNGSSAASNVVAVTALPTYFNLTGSIANSGVYNSFGYWTIPSIPSGSVASLVITGTVNTSVPQTIPAYANLLNSQQFDSNMLNNGTSTTVNISSGTPPTVGSISGPSLVCTGNSGAFAVNGVTNATTYYWSTNNGTVTSTAVTANVAFGAPGVANITVLPSNANCTGTSMNYSVTVSPCTGINEATNSIATKVYPNPTNGNLTIETTNTIEKIEILDINGKLVVSENNVNTNNITMNVGSLTNGVYVLRAKLVSGEVANSRIVLQK